MKRYHEEWTDLLSDHMAGDIDEGTRGRLEAHLAACADCRAVYADLRDLVAGAQALGEVEPPRDLWSEIASAIGGAPLTAHEGEAVVIELPTARAGGTGGLTHRVARALMTRTGLVAAAAGLVALTATTTWWLANASPGVGAGPAGQTRGTGAVLVVDAGAPPEGLATELAALEAALEIARSALDPNTVRVLERNLLVIEQAIADSRGALAVDPGNAFLADHLERMYRHKLDYLQDAVRAVEWSG